MDLTVKFDTTDLTDAPAKGEVRKSGDRVTLAIDGIEIATGTLRDDAQHSVEWDDAPDCLAMDDAEWHLGVAIDRELAKWKGPSTPSY